MLSGCSPWPDEFAERYRKAGYWAGQTIGDLVTEWALRSPAATALVDEDNRWNYDELDQRTSDLAAGFHELGIGRGDRVVVQLPNRVEFFEVLFGLCKLGAIPVIVLPAYRHAEVGYFCEYTGAVAYVTVDRHAGFAFGRMAEQVRRTATGLRHVIILGERGDAISLAELRLHSNGPRPDVDPADVALLHLSGGTTGVPKLIPRTHDDYLYGARAGAALCGFDEGTTYLCSLPVAHQFSLSAPGALGAFLSGGKVVLSAYPAPDATFPLIEQERVTVAAVVPPVAGLWVDAAGGHPADLSSLRLLQVGGAKLAAELARQVEPALGCQVQQVFGMTEGLLNFTGLDDPVETVFTTQGRPLSPADELLIVDDTDQPVEPGEAGHLLVRGPYTIRGYYKAPAHNRVAFTTDGFYRTGDIVRRLDTGHLVVVGRSKDQINRGGQKIAAEEVENELAAHPAVAEAAAVGIPDRYLGERVRVYVVPKGAVTERELLAFMRGRGLATYKVPDQIEFLDALPRTTVGKISKRLLRERHAQASPGGST